MKSVLLGVIALAIVGVFMYIGWQIKSPRRGKTELTTVDPTPIVPPALPPSAAPQAAAQPPPRAAAPVAPPLPMIVPKDVKEGDVAPPEIKKLIDAASAQLRDLVHPCFEGHNVDERDVMLRLSVVYKGGMAHAEEFALPENNKLPESVQGCVQDRVNRSTWQADAVDQRLNIEVPLVLTRR